MQYKELYRCQEKISYLENRQMNKYDVPEDPHPESHMIDKSNRHARTRLPATLLSYSNVLSGFALGLPRPSTDSAFQEDNFYAAFLNNCLIGHASPYSRVFGLCENLLTSVIVLAWGAILWGAL